MIAALGDLLTIGVGIAISPLVIVAVILMATAGKGRSTGTAFVLGCYAFTVAFIGALVLIGRGVDAEKPDSGPNITIDVIELVIGAGLLVLAYRQWRRRGEHTTPKWMDSLDSLTIGKAFVIGVLISGPLSPKDLPLLVAAGGRVSQADISTASTVAVILIFGVISVIGALIPWLMSVIAPGSVEAKLAGVRTWLVFNSAVIMTVLFVILGVKLIGTSIADLAG